MSHITPVGVRLRDMHAVSLARYAEYLEGV